MLIETNKVIYITLNFVFAYRRYRLLTVIPRTTAAGKFLAKLAESEESAVSL